MPRLRRALAWLLIWPSVLLIYYPICVLLVTALLVVCGGYRLLMGPEPPLSNCVLWAGWKWLAEAGRDMRAPKRGWPGGYLILRWSAWGPFLHLGWAPSGSIAMLAFTPRHHRRRRVPPALFRGYAERGE